MHQVIAIFMQDKIKKAFSALRKSGYECHMNWKCCQSCGCAAIKNEKKYVFYHAQDAERMSNGYVYLSFGGNGHEIARAMERAGLKVEWDGTDDQRIKVLA